jgi:hypothetical protein
VSCTRNVCVSVDGRPGTSDPPGVLLLNYIHHEGSLAKSPYTTLPECETTDLRKHRTPYQDFYPTRPSVYEGWGPTTPYHRRHGVPSLVPPDRMHRHPLRNAWTISRMDSIHRMTAMILHSSIHPSRNMRVWTRHQDRSLHRPTVVPRQELVRRSCPMGTDFLTRETPAGDCWPAMTQRHDSDTSHGSEYRIRAMVATHTGYR